MSYFAPDSNLYILKGVPLDLGQENTYYWGTNFARTLQLTHFLGEQHNTGYIKKILTHQTYQRVSENKIRVGWDTNGYPYNAVADYLQDCNYLVFQNHTFNSLLPSGTEPKWFFAFITEPPKYINNSTAEITYEIDPLQTWLPGVDYAFEECYIMRHHIPKSQDTIGANIEPEPVALGEYVYQPPVGDIRQYKRLDYYQGQEVTYRTVTVFVIGHTAFVDGNSYRGQIIDNVYNGLLYLVFPTWAQTYLDDVSGVIEWFSDNPDSILAIYNIPERFLPAGFFDTHTSFTWAPHGYLFNPRAASTSATNFFNAGGISTLNTLDGYLPKNAKMYTYPYNFYSVDNGCGDTLAVRYEFFDNLSVQFRESCTSICPAGSVLVPNNYKNATAICHNESISLEGFPMGAWVTDYFQAYMAEHAVDVGTQIGFGLGEAFLAKGKAKTAKTIGGIDSVIDGVTDIYKAALHADITKGSLKNGNPIYAHKEKDYYGGRMSVTAQRAEVIDNFMTRYGYAYNKLGTPNPQNRSRFYYVQTSGCAIQAFSGMSGIPASDAKKICDLMDRGLTWWSDRARIGQFTASDNL